MGMLCAKIDVIVGAMCESCLTPHELAEKAGVSVNIIYRMRRGFLVKMDAFGKVCRALGIDCKDVIDFERVQQYQGRKGAAE